MTDIDSADFFTDNELLANPYGHLAALRDECPLRREKHHDVVMVLYHRTSHSRQRRSQDMSEQRLPPLPAEAWGDEEYAAFGSGSTSSVYWCATPRWPARF